MCRNITTLRGLEPEATDEEIEAAARQYVRKVSGVQKTSDRTEAAFEKAVRRITLATEELLAQLPPRQQPPPTLPPLRRLAARAVAAPPTRRVARYALLLKANANRVFGESAFALARAELDRPRRVARWRAARGGTSDDRRRRLPARRRRRAASTTTQRPGCCRTCPRSTPCSRSTTTVGSVPVVDRAAAGARRGPRHHPALRRQDERGLHPPPREPGAGRRRATALDALARRRAAAAARSRVRAGHLAQPGRALRHGRLRHRRRPARRRCLPTSSSRPG